ncbi:hypothetical protein D3C74_295900 [compost metagenome]
MFAQHRTLGQMGRIDGLSLQCLSTHTVVGKVVFTNSPRCNVCVCNGLRGNLISSYRSCGNFRFCHCFVSNFVRLNRARGNVIFLDSLIRHMVFQHCPLP